jgi:uncharacterized protein with von Willebrand factor type A (vWA) domain
MMNDGRLMIGLMADGRKLVTLRDAAANLVAQLSELSELREQVRKAQLSARRSRRTRRRKRTSI